MKMIAYCLFLSLVACKPSGGQELDVEAFHKSISESNVQLLDVRTPEEFAQGHIPNATNVNKKDPHFNNQLSYLYKDVPVYVYCRTDSRSVDAAREMKAMGFKQVIVLKGGIEKWKEKGLPVVMPEPEHVEEKPDFKTAIQGDKLVLVDFNATWCGPCKMMQPYVDRMERTRHKEVTVLSIDTDVERELAMEYGITQLPTVMLFRKGRVLEKTIGYMDEQKLNALVDKHL